MSKYTCYVKKLVCILSFVLLSGGLLCGNRVHSEMVTLDAEIAESVLRFHILANSDSEEDQNLKLKVRDVVAAKVADDMKAAGIASKEEAESYVSRNANEYIKVAKEVIREQGYDYPVEALLSKHWFPVKVYGQYVFPEGEYDAFRMIIGEGAGKNWWCVLFPSLCLVEESYQVVPAKEITENANEEENVKFKFGIVEWFKDMW